jgi:hypothetical protein
MSVNNSVTTASVSLLSLSFQVTGVNTSMGDPNVSRAYALYALLRGVRDGKMVRDEIEGQASATVSVARQFNARCTSAVLRAKLLS